MPVMTARWPMGRGEQRPRLVQFADYGGLYSGSFIPMVTAITRAALDREWSAELVFSEVARGRPWLSDLVDAGFSCRILDVGPRAGLGRWASALTDERLAPNRRSRLSRAVAAVAQEVSVPTVLHTHFSSFDIAAAQACARAPYPRVIWHEHSGRPGAWTSPMTGRVRYRLLGRRVSAFLCVGPGVAESVRRMGGGDRVRFVPNAVDTQRFLPTDNTSRALARAEIGVTANARVLLHFGVPWTPKGGELFLAAVRLLNTALPEVRWQGFTVGTESARAGVDAAGLGGMVTVLERTEDVTALYAAADVFVSPSRAEGMPFAILEALATGLPVVASDIPGHAFIGRNASACRLTGLDPMSISAAIREVFESDDDTRAERRALTRRWIVDDMSLTAWAQAVADEHALVLEYG